MLERHSDLSASQVIAPQLERLSTEELVKCFEAFIRRNALLGDFVPKMEGEIASRASSPMPAEAACIARAFALNIATLTAVISHLPDMLRLS